MPLNYMYSHPGNLSPVSDSAWSQLEFLDTAATFVGGRCFHRDSRWSLWAEEFLSGRGAIGGGALDWRSRTRQILFPQEQSTPSTIK